MRSPQTPLLETRSPEEVTAEVRTYLSYEGGDHLADALVHIFGRYYELIAARLNLAPEKHHLAFLDLLGIQPAPPSAARVPLTFVTVEQLGQVVRAASFNGEYSERLIVPARTQAAGTSSSGQGGSVVFETERTLDLTSASLERIFAYDPATDSVADYSRLASAGGPSVRLFVDNYRPARHEFFVAWPATIAEGTSSIGLHFNIERGSQRFSAPLLQWFNPGVPDAARLQPDSDTTEGLTQTGDIVFTGFQGWPASVVNGVAAHWVQCKLVSPLPEPAAAAEEEERPPAIRRMSMSARMDVREALPEKGFFNAQTLDLSTGFYPLGFDPRFGDAFYLGSPLFVQGGAEIILSFDLHDAAAGHSESPGASGPPPSRLSVVWEGVSDGRWVSLHSDDGTNGLSQDGQVRFRLPSDARSIAVNGIDSGWIRARVAAVRNSEEGRVIAASTEASSAPPPIVEPLERFAPAVKRVAIDASKVFAAAAIASIVRFDDLGATELPLKGATPIAPFERIAGGAKSLYVSFNAATGEIMPATSLFFFLDEAPRGPVSLASGPNAAAIAGAGYWTGSDWTPAELVDETRGLTKSGNIVVRFGRSAPPRTRGFEPLYWVRLAWAPDKLAQAPLVTRVALNTVMAVNAVSADNELLGSSNETQHQSFACARKPIIGDVQLEVREAEPASALEVPASRARARRSAFGTNAVASEAPKESWIRWLAVDDFSESGPQGRHFVLDRWRGTVQFGDGRSGRIPPKGANNIRMRWYRAGGGSPGNVGAGAISELRSTLPYVSAVTNLVGAAGGSDFERTDRIIRRGSSWLRHRNRAVTEQDYEDLATAVPGIARAKCLPLRDLHADPDARRVYPGHVSVIVVPEGEAAAPRPTATQVGTVTEWLDARRPPEIVLTVAGPEYAAIDVLTRVLYDDRENVVEIVARCRARLDAYLHPLTGGPRGDGWSFGTRPTQSALSAIVQGVEGIDRLVSLDFRVRADRVDLLKGRLYLICSGHHDIICLAEPPEEPLASS